MSSEEEFYSKSISLDDPMFFQKVNALRPDLFNQDEMAKNIEEEKAKAPPQPIKELNPNE